MIDTRPLSLPRLARGIVDWLAASQDPDGNLRDPVSSQCLPPQHYALTLFAAACALDSTSSSRLGAGTSAVRYYLTIPSAERGAHELNCLGMLCVLRKWREHKVNPALTRTLEDQVRRWPFASIRGHVTNNWHAMRVACLAQRASLLESMTDRELALRCLYDQVLPQQTSDGLFADYPPGRSKFSLTPLTYHANFCAMLALILAEFKDERAATSLTRGLRVLSRLCAPDGESLYFGRSCNSLYGYAAAIFACRQGLHLHVLPGEDEADVAEAASRIARFITRMVGTDGAASAYPTLDTPARRGWDDYVNRLDYNAFAAFMLLQLPPESTTTVHRTRDIPVRLDTPASGIVVRGSQDVFAAFSTRGQVHTGSYMFVDARYSGMQVLALQHAGRPVIPPPPHEATDPAAPDWIGFMPVITSSGLSYAVRQYEDVVISDNDSITTILARGVPTSLRPFLRANGNRPVGSSTGIVARGRRMVRMALQRLHAPIPPAYRTIRLGGVQVRRAIILAPRWECLAVIDQVNGPFESAWASVRICDEWTLSPEVTTDSRTRTRIWFSPNGGRDVDSRTVYTSNGPASVLRVPMERGTPHATILAFGTMPAPDIRMEAGRNDVTLSFPPPRGRRLHINLESLRVSDG